eukprot:COSAG06_NODE_16503_length_997_cov_1.936526_1_plen_75_part_10
MAAVEILRRDALLFHLGVLALVAIIVGQGVGIYVGLASLSTQEARRRRRRERRRKQQRLTYDDLHKKEEGRKREL